MGQTWAALREDGANGAERRITQRENGGRVLPLDTLGLQESLMQLLRKKEETKKKFIKLQIQYKSQ